MSIAESPIIDQAMLAELRAMDDDGSFLNDLIELFRTDTAAQFAKLEAELQKEDHEQARRTAHRIKGSAGSLGAKKMAGIASAIQLAHDPSEMNSLTQDLKTAYAEALSQLR
jgi:two-component system, sensor histidine kinase and response regulator